MQYNSYFKTWLCIVNCLQGRDFCVGQINEEMMAEDMQIKEMQVNFDLEEKFAWLLLCSRILSQSRY